jgi:hypothetical protein
MQLPLGFKRLTGSLTAGESTEVFCALELSLSQFGTKKADIRKFELWKLHNAQLMVTQDDRFP